MSQRKRSSAKVSVALKVAPRRDTVEAIVDAAIAQVSLLYHRGAISTIVAIGDYLLEALFANDVALVASRDPRKSTAMRRLLERAGETPVSVHMLKRAIPIALQYRELPRKLAEQLPQSCHELLLLVGDVKEKERLVADAVARKLTVKQFDREVRKIRRKHAGGRIARPAVVRWAKEIARASAIELPLATLSATAVRALSAEDVIEAQAALHGAREAIERVSDALGRYRR